MARSWARSRRNSGCEGDEAVTEGEVRHAVDAEVGRDWQVSRVLVHRRRGYPAPPGEATHKRREPSHAPAERQACARHV
jgi:hypothetical protein